MKQFLNGVVQWKTSTCLIFTASMFIYLTMSLLFDNSQVSTALLWTLFWVCAGAAGGVLLHLDFQENAVHLAQPAVCGPLPAGADPGGLEGRVVPHGEGGGLDHVCGHLLSDLHRHDHRL